MRASSAKRSQFSPTRRSALARYGIAVLSVTMAMLVTWLLWRWITPNISPVFFAAVMVSAWYGGLGPGLLATLLASLASTFFLTDPTYSLQVDAGDFLRLNVFLAVAILISWLNEARARAEEALLLAFGQLEERVADRTADLQAANQRLQSEIAERARAEQELLEHQTQLRSLASELAIVEERERLRFATELHDEVGQLLAIGRMRLEALRDAVPSALAKDADGVVDLVVRSIQRVRSLMFQLSPPVLHEVGLVAAIEGLATQFRPSGPLAIVVEDDHQPKPLAEEVGIVLFQAIRELLVNADKHARASQVRIHISAEAGQIHICVEDNGVGFDPPRVRFVPGGLSGFGLFSIRERLEHLDGQMKLDSHPGGGTRVLLTAPLRKTETQSQEETKP